MNESKRPVVSFSRCRIILILVILIATSCQFPGFAQNETGCGASILKIGENAYEIKTIKPKSDGSLKIPANEPDNAFWVEETNTNQVFALSPTENNLALKSSLKSGDAAIVTWENCNSTTYKLSDVQAGLPDTSALLDQTSSQITIFVRENSTATGFVVKGELAEETISVFNTPDTSELQAEISLLEASTSEDGQTIEIEISILNYGESSFTLSSSDVSLTPENAAPLTPINTKPPLPHEIKPTETVTFLLTFPHPASQSATLKVLTVEYEVE